MGLPVDILSKEETFGLIESWFKEGIKRPKMIVTAYGMFLVNAARDKEFAEIVKQADLVTPDGNSVLAAAEYIRKTQRLKNAKNQNVENHNGVARTFRCLGEGLRVGWKILNGSIGETVTGVWLFEKIISKASENNWRIFLLGGRDNVAEKASAMLLKRFPSIKVAYDSGEKVAGTDPITDKRVVEKINSFKPDFLFVQYNPIVQEKWIDSHRDNLKVKVAMGYGGTLDEYIGRLKPSPKWFETHGLKWLWRLMLEPWRWHRMWDAVIVFPWLVFKESLKS